MPLARGQKLLFGCLAVFGAAVVLVIVAGAFFVHWVRTPGIPLEGSRLLDSGTAVYMEVRLRSEDPGSRDLVRAYLNASRVPRFPQDANVPPPVTMILESLPHRDATDKQVDSVLPIVIVARRQAGAEGTAEPPLLALSLSHVGNSVRIVHTVFNFLAWRSSKIKKEDHGGEDLFEMQSTIKDKEIPVWCSFVGTDVLIARDPVAVRSGLDTLRAATAAGGGEASGALLADRPADSSFYLAAKPGYGEAALDTIGIVLPELAETLRPAVKEGAGLTLFGTLRSADVVEGEVRVMTEGGKGAGSIADLGGSVTLMVGKSPLDLAFAPLPSRPGAGPAWKFSLHGLEAMVKERLRTRDVKIKTDL